MAAPTWLDANCVNARLCSNLHRAYAILCIRSSSSKFCRKCYSEISTLGFFAWICSNSWLLINMSTSPIGVTTSATYQYSPTASTSSTSSPVVASTDPGLAQEASALSTTAGIVATLGTTSTTSGLTYDAAGLYNSIAQAGTSTTTSSATSASTSGSNTAVSAQQSLDSAVLSSLSTSTSSGSSATSGYYNGTGVLQSTSSDSASLTANWSSALKANPNLSRVAVADSFAQGIVGTLSVTA